MLRTVDLTSLEGDYHSHVPRTALDVAGTMEAVWGVRDAIHDRGTEAPAEYSQCFDGVIPGTFRVPERVLAGTAGQLDPEFREAFEGSIRRRRLVAETLGHDSDPAPAILAEGARVGLHNIPVERISLYVPSRPAPLASSMIMNVIPAQVAKVRETAVASPPQAGFGGQPHPNTLALCHILGVKEVRAVDGAQATAVFAHGVTDLCTPIAMVIGPENTYVVAVKQLLWGTVGIDSKAGPIEIAIVADSSANPAYVAAGLISQAEYDSMAASVLIMGSPEPAGLMVAELESRAATTKHRERIRTVLTGQQSAVLLVRDLGQAVEVADTYAAEHLEIQTRDARRVTSRVRNTDATFVGDHSPVNLGDYSTGSAHVLPTAGCARHGSGLDMHSFMRTVHVIDYSTQALSKIADGIERFALTEDLPGHAAAITIRMRQ